MKRVLVFCLATTMMGVPFGAAIDRDVSMIDMIGMDMAGYRHVGYFGGSLWVENRLAAESEDWALVAGIGYGEYDIKDGKDPASWFAALGIKYYLTSFSSLSLVGSYRNFAHRSNFDILAGTATFKLRFIPPRFAISPYGVASASYQYCDFAAGYFSRQGEEFDALVTTLGAGVDFMARDDLAFTFEAGYSDSEDFNEGVEYADGVYAGVYLRYYWE